MVILYQAIPIQKSKFSEFPKLATKKMATLYQASAVPCVNYKRTIFTNSRIFKNTSEFILESKETFI